MANLALPSDTSQSFTGGESAAQEAARLYELKGEAILATIEKAAQLAEPVVASVASPVVEEKASVVEIVPPEEVEEPEEEEELEAEESLEEAPTDALLGAALDQSDQDEREQQPGDAEASAQPPIPITSLVIRQLFSSTASER